MKFNKKVFIYYCAIICLFLAILLIRSTFARYVTSLDTASHIEMGRWLLRINEHDILGNSNFSGVLSPIFKSEHDLIEKNKLAPTAKGYVDIEIDYLDVTVPFKYELTYVQGKDTYLDDFKLMTFSIDDDEFEYNDEPITNVIVPDNTTTKQLIRLNYEWLDGDSTTLDDIEDTDFIRTFENIFLNYTIKFTQLTPEDITP